MEDCDMNDSADMNDSVDETAMKQFCIKCEPMDEFPHSEEPVAVHAETIPTSHPNEDIVKAEAIDTPIDVQLEVELSGGDQASSPLSPTLISSPPSPAPISSPASRELIPSPSLLKAEPVIPPVDIEIDATDPLEDDELSSVGMYKQPHIKLIDVMKIKFNQGQTEGKHLDISSLLFCTICFVGFQEREILQHHLTAHDQDFIYCDLCNLKSKRMNSVELHKKTIHGQMDIFNCKYCDYSSTVLKSMYMHQNSVHLGMESLNFKCTLCTFRTGDAYNLSRHRITVHRSVTGDHNMKGPVVLRIYRCAQCEYQTPSRPHLLEHEQRIHRIKNYKILHCDQCEFQTIVQAHLRRHLLTHMPIGSKAFQCADCHYETNYSQHLTRHQQSFHPPISAEMKHLDQDRFPKKYFSLYLPDDRISQPEMSELKKIFSELNEHYRKVCKAGKTKYDCIRCEFATAHLTSMRTHAIAKHTSYKPFKCVQCGYATSSRVYIRQHISSVHEKTFKRDKKKF